MNVAEEHLEMTGDDWDEAYAFPPGTLVSCPNYDTFITRHLELREDGRHIWYGSYRDSDEHANVIGIVLTVTPGGGCNTLLLTNVGMRWTWSRWLTEVNA